MVRVGCVNGGNRQLVGEGLGSGCWVPTGWGLEVGTWGGVGVRGEGGWGALHASIVEAKHGRHVWVYLHHPDT